MQSNRGFTLIELLVVTGLIIFITSLTFMNWQSAQGSLSLQRGIHQLAQDVARTQELSLQSRSFDCASGSISGYGIYFNQSVPDSYLIFAECNNTNAYEAASDGLVETVSFQKGVKITALSPSPASIVFLPPDPQIFIKPGDPSQAQITLGQDTATRSVIVNQRGIVDVQ